MTEGPLDLSKYTMKPSEMNKPNLIILYGPPGGGKTHFGASVAELKEFSPVLILDTENSTVGTLTSFADDDIDIIKIEDIDSFNTLFDALCSREHKYKTVIIDTLDVIQSMFIEDAMAKEESKREPDTRAVWGAVRKWTVSVIDRMNRAPFLSILIAHQTEEKLDSGILIKRIALSGSAKEIVAGRADIVGFVTRDIQDDNTEMTTAQFGSSDRAASKNRFNLPVKMEDPSMKKVMAAIRKKGDK